MNDYTFADLMSIDATQWGTEIDPIGLLSYQAYKRRRGVIGESAEQIDEVLTPQQRMKRKAIMRRLAPRLARARKLAMKRRGGTNVLKRRAKSLARRSMAKKLLGGRSKSSVSPSERARIERILARKGKAVERLAVKMIPVVRKKQAARFAKKSQVKRPAAHKPAARPKPTVHKPAPKPKPIVHKPIVQKRVTAPTAPKAPTSPKAS